MPGGQAAAVDRAWHFTCGRRSRGSSDATRQLAAHLPLHSVSHRFLRELAGGAPLRRPAGAIGRRTPRRAVRRGSAACRRHGDATGSARARRVRRSGAASFRVGRRSWRNAATDPHRIDKDRQPCAGDREGGRAAQLRSDRDGLSWRRQGIPTVVRIDHRRGDEDHQRTCRRGSSQPAAGTFAGLEPGRSEACLVGAFGPTLAAFATVLIVKQPLGERDDCLVSRCVIDCRRESSVSGPPWRCSQHVRRRVGCCVADWRGTARAGPLR